MGDGLSTSLDCAVAVTVGGVDYRLEPTIAAYRHISRFYKSLGLCAERVAVFDVDAIAAVIIAGSGQDFTEDAAEALALAYFGEALKAPAANACVDYLTLLHRGGVPEAPAKKGAAKKAGAKKDTKPGNR